MPRYDDDRNPAFRFRLGDMRIIFVFIAISIGLSIVGSILGPPWSTIIFVGTWAFLAFSLIRIALVYRKRTQVQNHKPEKTWKSYSSGVPKKYPYNVRRDPQKRRPRKPTDDDWESTVNT